MIRSLYSRVVVTFLGAVLLGLIAAFFAANYWFQDQFSTAIREEMHKAALDLTETYAHTVDMDLDAYLKGRAAVHGYVITVYDSAGEISEYGAMPDRHTPEIPPEAAALVLQNHSYDNSQPSPDRLILGYPIVSKGSHYALFLRLAFMKPANDLRRVLLTSLAIVLFTGSVLILIAARYLVQPLKLMTRATQRIAKGDFNINLNWKQRKDELGELADNFSHMASELKQMERMRQDFVSNVSHEIQSPLTSIAGFSKVLRSRDMPPDERNHYLDIIRDETERLSRLSENLLKLASLESEHHPFHPHTFDLDEQLRRVIVSLEPQWSAKELELDLQLPAVKIAADEDQLSQVWMNLLGNAIKFTPDQGKISASLKPLTDRVRVSIRDNGIGISPEDQKHIFDRFYKADRSRHREDGGNGLGLAIVKKIVDLHHGTIEVRSEPGQGTTFIVTLPSIPAER
ncbi:HAMP domain-containing sensor histidine kinase [Paenibacillus filicis]|uniref:histidine kinase n=1 Tax=Paenibacillus gyeongsangnamensis TaxID=3388067 RepID=A0ABT4Q8T5_9BACL|nr:HAMP domain-containing sensor histidine kinase [Paenibacillus filicis]MCZ8513289.1 HAMP domain-containing sensor histidine kinase [Paenibacillus filicis]